MTRSVQALLDKTHNSIRYHDEEYVSEFVEQCEPQLSMMGIQFVASHNSISPSDYNHIRNCILVYMDGFKPVGLKLPLIRDEGRKTVYVEDRDLSESRERRTNSQMDGSGNCQSYQPYANVIIKSRYTNDTIAVYFKHINAWYTSDITHQFNEFTRMVVDVMIDSTIGTPTAERILDVLERGVQASEVLRLVDSKGRTYELVPMKVTNDGADARIKEMRSKFTTIINSYIKGLDQNYNRKLKDVEKKLLRVTAPIPPVSMNDLADYGISISGYTGTPLGLMVASPRNISVKYARVITPIDGVDRVINIPEDMWYNVDVMVVLATQYIPKNNNFQVTGIRLINPDNWTGVSTGHALGSHGEQCTGNLNLSSMTLPNASDFAARARDHIDTATALFETFNATSPGQINSPAMRKMHRWIIGKYYDRVQPSNLERGVVLYLRQSIKKASVADKERYGEDYTIIGTIPADGKEPEYFKIDTPVKYREFTPNGSRAVFDDFPYAIRFEHLRFLPENQIFGHEPRRTPATPAPSEENLLWRA